MPQDPASIELPPGAPERIAANVRACRQEIAAAAIRCGREPSSVALLAVTKYVPASVIRMLHTAGLHAFGESRVQRLPGLTGELADLDDIEWHLIGHLQRNKVRKALECCRIVHSVDSLRLAEEIITRQTPLPGEAAPAMVDLYVEVNVSEETAKTGLSASDAPTVLTALATATSCGAALRVAGLMAMARFGESPEDARPSFRRLRELRDRYESEALLPAAAGLSMGMSHDFAVAIEEGATIVRVGRRLFRGVLPD